MPALQRCPHGHTWNDPDGAAGSGSSTCPICSTNLEIPVLRLEPAEKGSAVREEARPVRLPSPASADRPFGDRQTINLPAAVVEREDRATVSQPADSDPELPQAPPLPEEPPTIPGYEILRVLSRGGMGVVYLARATANGRLVALKTVAGDLGNDEAARQAFLRQASAVAGLHHPNILGILEIGEARGRPFFCLEYVAGGSLAEQLRGVPQPPREAAALVELLARAMQFAHDHAVVHRDLKPSNVLLDREPAPAGTAGPPIPKIADFGLAQPLPADGTRGGWILGTPCYMAPEQAAGKIAEVGPAADIWGLGAILYEMLTGRPPFQGATLLDTLRLVQTAPVVAPRRLNATVPVDLETICLRCLRKEPGQRYASMAELADDLKRFLTAQPIKARRRSTAEHWQRWIARNPGVSLLVGAVLLALVLLTAGSLWSAWALQAALRDKDEATLQARQERDAVTAKQRELWERDVALRRLLYAADVQQAQQLWQQGDVRSMCEVLAPYREAGSPPTPDFAYRHLEHLLHGEVATLPGATGDLYTLAWSPDATRLVVGGENGELRFWDVPSGRLVQTVTAHDKDVNAVAFAPDGRLVATGSDDGRIGLWTPAGELDRYLPTRGTPVVALVFAGDGRGLYAGTDGGELLYWSLDPDGPPLELADFQGRIEMLVRSRDGRRLAAAVGPLGARVIDLNDTKNSTAFEVRDVKVVSVALAPSGRALAVGRNDGRVTLFDLATGQEARKLDGHVGRVHALSFTPDEELLLSGGEDGGIALWDPVRGRHRGTLRGHSSRVWCLAVAPGGGLLASSSGNGVVKLWSPTPRSEYGVVMERAAPVRALAPLPGTPLAALGTEQGLELVPLAGGQRRVLPVHEGLHTLAASSDRRHLLAAQARGDVVLYDLATETPHHLMRSSRNEAAVAISGDGKLAAASDGTGFVRLWEVPSRKPLPDAGAGTVEATALAFLRGSPMLAIGGRDGHVTLWDVRTGKAALSWQAHKGAVFALACSPDGAILVSGGEDGSARLWNAETGREIHHGLLGHGRAVAAVAFSPDGRTVATATATVGSVRLWSALTGRALLRFDLPSTPTAVGFADDDTLLVAGDGRRGGFLWRYSARPEPSSCR